MTSYQAFREKLDQEHQWPAVYMFKFIVPKEKETEIKQLFSQNKFEIKSSRKGNYISFTMKLEMQSSDQVIEIYQQAHQIEGIIAL